MQNQAKEKFTFWIIMGLILSVCLVAILAPVIATHNPFTISLSESLLPPSNQYIFGTDLYGRDVFSRVVYGARTSISISLTLVLVTMLIGTIIGMLSAYLGGKVDTILTGISSVTLSFPDMILALAIAGILGRGTLNAFITLAAIGWVKYARLSRGIVLKTCSKDYFKAAKVTGTTGKHILWKYLLPETLPSILITAAMDIGTVLLAFAALSFLGLGISVDIPEWGSMLNEGRAHMEKAPWLVIYPGLAIFAVITVFNIFGDTVRDYLDPKNGSNQFFTHH